MRRYLSLYRYVLKFALLKNLAYPQDFVIWAAIDLLWSAVNLGFFKILLLRVPSISGWSFEQLAIILGLVHVLSAFVWGAMYGNMKELAKDINRGNLDLYLTKPANSQFLASTKSISLNLIPTLLIGLFLVYYGLALNAKLDGFSLAIVAATVLASVVISYAMWFITVTVAMWFGRLVNVAELFPHSLDIARYPLDIYPPVAKSALTFLIPLGVVGFLPAEILLGRTAWYYIFIPLVLAGVFLWLSHRFWNFALRHYTSASS